MSQDYKVIVSFSLGMLAKINENIVNPKKINSLIEQAQWILDDGLFDVTTDPEHYQTAKEYLHELVRYLGGVESVCASLHKRKYNLKYNWQQYKKGTGSIGALREDQRSRSMGKTFTQFVQLYYSHFSNMKKQLSHEVSKKRSKPPSFIPPYFPRMRFGGKRRKSRRRSHRKSPRRRCVRRKSRRRSRR